MNPGKEDGAAVDAAKGVAATALTAVSVLVVVVSGLIGCSCNRSTDQPDVAGLDQPPDLSETEQQAVLDRGLALFAKDCAACHGKKGRGGAKGVHTAAYLLYPKPRDFSNGTFLLTSTEIGLPSDDDLLKTLKYGMPGSAMPSWGHYGEDDLKALVAAVRHLAIEGQVSQLTSESGLPPDEALTVAHEMLDSGPRVELPAKPENIDLARGKEVYLEACASCHDPDGRGLLKRDLKDEYGYPSFARDFTQGIFKGGSDDEAMAMRLVRGLPGSPMPGKDYTPEDLWSVVRYVQTMIKPGAQERIEQRHQTLTAKRVEGPLPVDPANAEWEESPGTFLALMPLWWRDDRIEGVTVQALHDGSKLAVRLSWDDATQDENTLGQTAFSDGAAIQLSATEFPPLFAMGAAGAEVDVWFWRAARQQAAEGGSLALKGVYPNMPHTDEDAYPGTPKDEIFATALGAGNPVSTVEPDSSVENLHAQGFGTLTNRGPAVQEVDGSASRVNDSWQVVFVRDLEPGSEGGIRFVAGQSAYIAFAVWDGNAGDRNGQKSVTIWHGLEFED